MKKGFVYIICLLLIGWFWSCSTKKNTKISRAYHAFNSQYNIYYNGKLAFDQALSDLQKNYQESYSDIIHMSPVSAQPKDKAEPGGPFDRAIEKSNKAIKLHSIKAKPAKKPGWRNDPKQRAFQQQEEYNPFLKHCWLLMGQAQFYNADFLQASATFSYIARHYSTDPEVMTLARLWQARCYSEMDWFYEAEDILNKLNKEGIPKKNLDFYATVYADYLVKNKDFEEAVPYFKTAIKAEKNKLQRARMKYLLGQMYTAQDQPGLAFQMFKEVIRANPPYPLEFAARIRQTEVLTGVDDQKVIKMLKRMARNDKNKELLDQVYYALGNVYMARLDTATAIENYHLAIDKSVKNGLEKAICQIRLGDLYFQQKNYIKAQPCFSGALAGIQKEYKDYERVSKLSAVLDELVVHAEAVHLQDSLQTLAAMPETERLAVIDKVIEKLKEEEKKAEEEAAKEEYLAEQESKGTGIDRPGTAAKPVIMPTGQGGAGFYFYNPQTVSQGKAAFQRKWGRRPNEDNWRRRKKKMSTFEEKDDQETSDNTEQNVAEGEGDETTTAAADSLEQVAISDPHQRAYYLQQLPMTPEDIEASNIIIIDGLFNMAMIYKDKLEDFHLSVNGFEELDRRFPGNKYKLESYYQLYLLGLRYHDQALAAQYKDKLIAVFPESDYAVAIANPNYEYNIRTMDKAQDSIYTETYDSYLAGDTIKVRRNYEKVQVDYPLATLMPKFMFLNSLTYVQAGDVEGFKKTLKELLDKYPNADVSELAGEMMKGVLRGRALVSGGIKGMEWNLRFGLSEDGTLTAADSARVFTAEPTTPYKVILMFPTGSLDRNQLLFAVAAYNFAHFMVKQLDMSFEEAGPMSMLSISGFYNIKEIVHYYKMIYEADGYGKALDKNVAILPISEDNYETLMHGKTLDEYVQFFDQHFGQQLPEIARRWKEREADSKEAASESAEESETSEPESAESEATDPVAEPVIEKPVQPVVVDTIKAVKDTVPVVVTDTLPVTQPVDTTIIAPADTVKVEEQPVVVPPSRPEKAKKLTLDDIKEIRQQEALEEEERKKEKRQQFAEEQEKEKAFREKQSVRNEELIKKQQAEEEQLLKSKVDREKQLAKDRKEKMKQREEELKAKEKAYKELRKQKERDYKERLKAKEKERAEKEKEYKRKLKAKEKAYKEMRKAKEKARKMR